MIHLEINKGDTDLYIESDKETISLSVSFQDTMDYRTNQITLNKEDIVKIIETFKNMLI